MQTAMEKPHLTQHRLLFPPGYAVHFDVDLKPKPFSISYLANAVLTELLPRSAFQEGEILGLKGRGAWTGTSGDRCPAPEAPEARGGGCPVPEEEILYLEGRTLPVSEESEARLEKEPTGAESFSVRLKTIFKEFVGAKGIAHRVNVDRNGSIFEAVGIEEVGRAIPVEIVRVRLGVDIFEGTFLGSYFGFAPVVRKSFLLDCDQQNLRVELDLEGVKDRKTPLFSIHPLLAKIPPLVSGITGKDLNGIVRQAEAA